MFSRVSSYLIASAAAFVVVACGRASEVSAPKFDAGYSVGMDATITNGVLITSSSSTTWITREAKDQLYYTMGQLNYFRGVADLNRTVISVNEVLPLGNGLYEAHYAAKLFVSWPRNAAVPASLQLILPAKMDSTSISAFVEKYQACRDDFSHDPEVGNFWYYWRPEVGGCALRNGGLVGEDRLEVQRVGMSMVVSAENTQGKSPEYGKVWEDNQLVVTAMFGKAEDGATSPSDAGISSFNSMYQVLRQNFGTPIFQSVPLDANASPAPQINDVEMTFATPQGQLNVVIMLVEGVRNMTSAQTARYNDRTKRSDLVSYSGHSGLGANIRALTRMGSFLPGQYQIFFVNGCDTFAYVENSLRDAHAAANPGFGPSKYFDMITNSMPSYFHMNAYGNLTLIKSLLGRQLNYRQILGQIDSSQMPVVTGEEDNLWPNAFQ